MWLTGFDVECLSTLYIDKPMKAHTLMQAIARANLVYPGKHCVVIVDYNGMLKALRAALADYATGDEAAGEEAEPIAPIEVLLAALIEAIKAAENHLKGLGFDPVRLENATGFSHIEALKDAVDAVYTSDESKRRFEIMARQVFIRFKTLLMEPSAFRYAERHDNIEAIYKKLTERRDTADVTEVLKALHRIVNEAIRAHAPGDDHAEGLKVDLSKVDFDKLREEFASKVKRKHAALQDIRELIEKKLAQMLVGNPMRMDYYKKYQQIICRLQQRKRPRHHRADLRPARRTGQQPRCRTAPCGRRRTYRRRVGRIRSTDEKGHQQERPRKSETGQQGTAWRTDGIARTDARLDAKHGDTGGG